MKEAYRNGLAEVDEILNYADEQSLKKVPKQFKEFIKNNKSDYKVEIDSKKDLKEQELLYETKVILSVMYKEYWASEEERQKIIEEDKKELQKEEKEKTQKLNEYSNIFTNKKIEESNNEEIKKPTIIKENIIKKILNKIKKIFKLGGNDKKD